MYYLQAKSCPFWMEVTSWSFGIILLIGETIKENKISKICTFRALQVSSDTTNEAAVALPRWCQHHLAAPPVPFLCSFSLDLSFSLSLSSLCVSYVPRSARGRPSHTVTGWSIGLNRAATATARLPRSSSLSISLWFAMMKKVKSRTTEPPPHDWTWFNPFSFFFSIFLKAWLDGF